MKLIYINGVPTSMIFGLKLDAWWFSENGFDVEFWDTSPLYYSKNQLDKYYGGNEEYKYIGPNYKLIESEKEFMEQLNQLAQGSKIFYLSRSIYKIIEDDNVLKAIQDSKLDFYLKQFDNSNLMHSGIEKLKFNIKMLLKHKRANKKIQPKGFFGCGIKGRSSIQDVFPYTNFISIPSPKIEWKAQSRDIVKDYIIFVDESIEYAPDAKMLGYEVSIDLDGYYTRMNKLFDNLEESLGMSVVIGASGKYIYPKNRFGGRDIIYKKTFSLIEHATLVVGHTSSALDHNIKCKKPMLFIDDKSFTQYKRDGFKTAIPLIGNKIYMSDEVTKEDIENILKKENKDFHRLVNDYFKEDGVNEDYREIMAKAFRECIANKIQT